MQIVNVKQGTPEWHTHRATALNASDAPAMMGISKYKTRAQLIKERATGMMPEVDDATQRRFNDGHRFEALARPLAEVIIGDELSPVTGMNGKYSSSFDGITFAGDVIMEHKTLNDEIRKAIGANGNTGGLDEQYRIQMEHQLMVSDAGKCLFMASKWDGDTLVEEVHGWYLPDHALRARIVAGWEQFEKDVATYQPTEEVVEVIADAVIALPSLAVQIKGEVTTSNLPVFVSAADKFLAGIKTDLETDQDFVNAEANVKACKVAEDGIEQTKKAITAQAISIDEVMRTMDLYKEKLAAVRLKLDKLVKSEKEKRKEAIIEKARITFNENFVALEAEIKPIRLIAQHPDFAGAMKGLKKLTAMQAAVDTALRDGIFAAEKAAKDVRAKLAWCKENAAGMSMLFPDLQQLVAKPMEDFVLTITSRIEKHKADEAAKLEAERQRMVSEAKATAEREAAAELAAREDHIRSEERARAIAEATEAKRKEEVGKNVTQHDQPASCSVAKHEADPVQKNMECPNRGALIAVVVAGFGVSYQTAEQWMIEAFSTNEAIHDQQG